MISKSGLAELAELQVSDFWRTAAGAVAAFLTFLALQALLAMLRGEPPPKRGEKPPPEFMTDLWWWLCKPVIGLMARVTLTVLIVLVALVFGREVGAGVLLGFGPLARQPYWAMLLEMFVLADLAGYWAHRLSHTLPFLWRFHAVHHSPKQIYWTSTSRVHPVNELLNYAAMVLPFAAVGFPAEVLIPYVPLVALYAVFCHSRTRTSLGPLGRILNSPLLHRWHHTYPHEGGNKNFGGVFALWDWMFGTYYLPKDRLPETFGIEDGDVPESFLRQLVHPFRAQRPVKTIA